MIINYDSCTRYRQYSSHKDSIYDQRAFKRFDCGVDFILMVQTPQISHQNLANV